METSSSSKATQQKATLFRDYEFHDIPEWGSKFVFGKQLGEGKFGRVFAVKEKKSGAQWKALKIMIFECPHKGKTECDCTEADFMSEVDHLSTLQHIKGILPLEKVFFCKHEIGLLLPLAVKFSKWWENRSKKHRNALDKVKDIIVVSKYLLEAVGDLHVAGFMHCDIKLSNFVFYSGRPYLIDLGHSRRIIASKQDQRYFYDDDVMCVRYYRAPELFHGCFTEYDLENDNNNGNIGMQQWPSNVTEQQSGMDVQKTESLVQSQWLDDEDATFKKTYSDPFEQELKKQLDQQPKKKIMPRKRNNNQVLKPGLSKHALEAQMKQLQLKEQVEQKLKTKYEGNPTKQLEENDSEGDSEDDGDDSKDSDYDENSEGEESESPSTSLSEEDYLFADEQNARFHFYNHKIDEFGLGIVILRLLWDDERDYYFDGEIYMQFHLLLCHFFNYYGYRPYKDQFGKLEPIDQTKHSPENHNISKDLLKWYEDENEKLETSDEKTEFKKYMKSLFYMVCKLLDPNPNNRSNCHQLLEKLFTSNSLSTEKEGVFSQLEVFPDWKDWIPYSNDVDTTNLIPKQSLAPIQKILRLFFEYKCEQEVIAPSFYHTIFLWSRCLRNNSKFANGVDNLKASFLVCYFLSCSYLNMSITLHRELLERGDFKVSREKLKSAKIDILKMFNGRVWFPSFFANDNDDIWKWNPKRETNNFHYISDFIRTNTRFPTIEEFYKTMPTEALAPPKKRDPKTMFYAWDL